MRKIYFTCLLCLLSSACQISQPQKSQPRKPLVWVSVAPYQHLVERLAGSDIEVDTIVPKQADPHSFEPSSRQLADMDRGVIWFRIGEPFEKKILPLLVEQNAKLAILDLRETVPLIADETLSCSHCNMDHQDRHIWMSPEGTQTQVIAIARTLQKVFPEKASAIDANLDLLLQDLKQLDAKIRSLLAPSKHKTILVSHPAFGYFCRDYACEQLSIEYEGKEPRPKQIEAILEQAIAHHTEVAIALPQYNNKGAQLIAKKLHIPVRMIDPYSADYFTMMLSLAETISQTQGESSP